MRTITVTGHGSVTVEPDSAEVRVALAFRARSVAEAVAGCDAAFRVAADVASRHTEPGRIATRNVHVGQAWEDGGPRGFEAEHTLAIGCPDLASAGALVTDLADEVGDLLRVETVHLTVSDSGDARAAARLLAYDDAVARAQALAAHAGATLGEVRQIGAEQRVGGGGDVPLMAKIGLQPGETAVTESVTVSFALD